MPFLNLKSRLFSRDMKYPVIIFGLAIVLRLLFLLIMLSQTGLAGLYDQYADPIKYINAADYLLGRNQMGQYELFLVGIGYPSVLALSRIFMGQSFLLIIIVQILLSSFSCFLIYKIAEFLTSNRAVSILAGLLAATSLTSISLANALLTESFFFFLFTLSFYLFLKGLTEEGWKNSILSGVTGGGAILFRSASTFFPTILVLTAFIIPVAKQNRKRALIRSIIISLIMISIPAVWGFRNLLTHDIFTVSGSGTLAAKTYLTSKVLIEGEGRHVRDLSNLRDSLYKSSLDQFYAGNYRKGQEENTALVLSTARKYPSPFLKNFFLIILDNVTAVSSLHYLQLPGLRPLFEAIDYFWNRGANNTTMLILSLLGFFIVARLNLRVALILLANMVYFAFISGVTFAQGSRIYFPAQCTQLILAATSLVFFYNLIQVTGKNVVFHRNKSGHQKMLQ